MIPICYSCCFNEWDEIKGTLVKALFFQNTTQPFLTYIYIVTKFILILSRAQFFRLPAPYSSLDCSATESAVKKSEFFINVLSTICAQQILEVSQESRCYCKWLKWLVGPLARTVLLDKNILSSGLWKTLKHHIRDRYIESQMLELSLGDRPIQHPHLF